jgi:hypothetical protein
MCRRFGRSLVLLACASAPVALGQSPPDAAGKPLEFHITFAESVSKEPFTGRVVVMLGRGGEPRLGPDWFNPQPMFARDVKDWLPGKPLIVGSDAVSFPVPLAQLRKATYSMQAVMDFDRGYREFSNAPGNGYSDTVRMELDPRQTGPIKLHIDQVVKEKPFRERDRVKLVDIESKLVTAFTGRPVRLRASIHLPASYPQEPAKKYPVVYEIPGFSGNHFMMPVDLNPRQLQQAGVETIHVVLDPDCRLGHHVFADSSNNGPYGKALTEELIPHIEKNFRAIGAPTARFVTGHSSGGWSSLWLQVTYPDFFGGCWSTSPDPVDFRDFQRINIYQPGANMFKDEQGNDRPIARAGGRNLIFYRPFSDMEEVMGHGGQLGSFEAVFSPRGPDGRPMKLWDRKTGAINPAVAKAWEAYDIRLVLERNWATLGPKLAGKLHVYMGSEDTFLLEGAVKLLKESQARLGSDAVVEIIPGRDHSSLLFDPAVTKRMAAEAAAAFRRHHPAP